MEKYSVPLTDDQFQRLWEDKQKHIATGRMLAATISHLAEIQALDDSLFWEVVSRLCGGVDFQRCEIDWVNRCVIVNPEKGSEE